MALQHVKRDRITKFCTRLLFFFFAPSTWNDKQVFLLHQKTLLKRILHKKNGCFPDDHLQAEATPDYHLQETATMKRAWNNFDSRDASASKNECMNDWRRCKSNAELLKCCFTCIRHIQSAFLHSGISHMYKLYLNVSICMSIYLSVWFRCI